VTQNMYQNKICIRTERLKLVRSTKLSQSRHNGNRNNLGEPQRLQHQAALPPASFRMEEAQRAPHECCCSHLHPVAHMGSSH
jgi:hypothetical protein